jgi:hypothetical protein
VWHFMIMRRPRPAGTSRTLLNGLLKTKDMPHKAAKFRPDSLSGGAFRRI